MHFSHSVRHSGVWFGVLRPPSAPKRTQVDQHTYAQFIPKMPGARIGPRTDSKNHDLPFSNQGRAFRRPLFRQYLSPRVRLKATRTHSLFPKWETRSGASIICCTYVRDCGIPPQTPPEAVKMYENYRSVQCVSAARVGRRQD